MAKANPKLIQAINNTITHLNQSDDYQWGHMGSCNCGYLAQSITQLSKDKIHSRAMQKYGDWTEQLNDYCPTSGLLMDELIDKMLNFGLDTNDLKNLERLSDENILRSLPKEKRYLRHNSKADLIIYLAAWSTKLEEEIIERIKLPEVTVHDQKLEIATIS